jgi:hypothetical protein
MQKLFPWLKGRWSFKVVNSQGEAKFSTWRQGNGKGRMVKEQRSPFYPFPFRESQKKTLGVFLIKKGPKSDLYFRFYFLFGLLVYLGKCY